MPEKRRGAPRRGHAPHPGPIRGARTGANRSSEPDGALVGRRKLSGNCPVDPRHVGKLVVEEKPAGSPGPPWWINCFACPTGKPYTDALKKVVGVPASLIFEEPEVHLAPWLTGQGEARDNYGPPPSEGSVAGWCSNLQTSGDALRYLVEERGLLLETIDQHELGYDGHAITIPIRNAAGELHSVKRRAIRPGAIEPKRGLSRPAALYPAQVLATRPRAVVLCEGEFDALLLNQGQPLERDPGIPAVTSTAGTGGWTKYPEWHERFVGRTVAVIYDCGALSYVKAVTRAEALIAAGAKDAWPVDLGLAQGEDVSDWFVKHGRAVKDLRKLIRAERRRWSR